MPQHLGEVDEAQPAHREAAALGADRSFRPELPGAGLIERGRDWVEWFGPLRLLTSSLAVIAVCVGAWFMVRQPPPPSESSLPVATPSTNPLSATLPTLASATPAVLDSTIEGPVVVHVAGAVHAPGVYELVAGSRVDDAIAIAGGASEAAEPARLNLAATLADGQRVYVPAVGEVVANEVIAADQGGGDVPLPAGPVDVNRAGLAELETLPGVGPATAAAIVTERERNGPFMSVNDLERVPGIGPAKLAGLADQVVV